MDSKKSEKIEQHPDGWKRFEGAIDIALKTPAKHNIAHKKKAASRKKRPNKLGNA